MLRVFTFVFFFTITISVRLLTNENYVFVFFSTSYLMCFFLDRTSMNRVWMVMWLNDLKTGLWYRQIAYYVIAYLPPLPNKKVNAAAIAKMICESIRYGIGKMKFAVQQGQRLRKFSYYCCCCSSLKVGFCFKETIWFRLGDLWLWQTNDTSLKLTIGNFEQLTDFFAK